MELTGPLGQAFEGEMDDWNAKLIFENGGWIDQLEIAITCAEDEAGNTRGVMNDYAIARQLVGQCVRIGDSLRRHKTVGAEIQRRFDTEVQSFAATQKVDRIEAFSIIRSELLPECWWLGENNRPGGFKEYSTANTIPLAKKVLKLWREAIDAARQQV